MIVSSGNHPGGMGGTQVVHKFDNGYGASVIQTPFSYGGNEGLYEIAVIKWEDNDWSICYDTPITNDVIGYQTEEEVDMVLTAIEALPPHS